MQYLVALCSRSEAASDVLYGRLVGPIVPDKNAKVGEPHLNLSGEIPPTAVGGGSFDGFFAITSNGK